MTAPKPGNIDRRELLPQLFPNHEEWLFVSGLAGASKDAAALTNDGANIYTMAGTMGAAVAMGLGIALSAPNKNVAAINGDGEMLMGIGSLITVATAQPQNLTIVCEDNAMHGETGRQTGHTAGAAILRRSHKARASHQPCQFPNPRRLRQRQLSSAKHQAHGSCWFAFCRPSRPPSSATWTWPLAESIPRSFCC